MVMQPPGNDAIDHARLRQLADEFTEHWKRLQSFYLDAVAGFAFILGHVESEQDRARSFVRGTEVDSIAFQDTRRFSYEDIFAEGFCTSAIHEATQGEVKARNRPSGANYVTLGQLCLIAFYDFWNDYLRREYVIAKGYLGPTETNNEIVQACLRTHASHDLWGDLYYLRTSIVHNRGVATSAIEKCKLIKWFKPGDAIALTPDRMRAVFLALLTFRNELFREQFPPVHIQL
jgi:hypothetical protein